MDVLAKIYVASKYDKKSLIESALKLTEEVGELAEAVLSYKEANGCVYKEKTANDVIEECIDVIIMAGATLQKTITEHHPEYDKLPPQILRVLDKKLAKWKEKVTENHEEDNHNL